MEKGEQDGEEEGSRMRRRGEQDSGGRTGMEEKGQDGEKGEQKWRKGCRVVEEGEWNVGVGTGVEVGRAG